MIRYAGPFVLLASIPVFFFAFGPAAPFATIGLLLTALVGAEFLSPRGAVIEAGDNPFGFRVLLYLYIPLQLGVTIWAIDAASHTSALGVAALILANGVTTGVFGMLAAHEMIHSKSRAERVFGTIMLSGMTYRHFRIAHVHGHHRFAATHLDSASARLGESFYAFLIRTLSGQLREAWAFEQRRCAMRPLASLHNRIFQDAVFTLVLFGAIYFLWGITGILIFAGQSAVAIIVLEMFNYIAHYGLARRAVPGGGFEPLSDSHSWNSSNVAANLLIFNMGRHSYHHRRPASPYENLRYLDAAPELPAGYAASILLALIPPLWRLVMDPKALAHRADEDERLAA